MEIPATAPDGLYCPHCPLREKEVGPDILGRVGVLVDIGEPVIARADRQRKGDGHRGASKEFHFSLESRRWRSACEGQVKPVAALRWELSELDSLHVAGIERRFRIEVGHVGVEPKVAA